MSEPQRYPRISHLPWSPGRSGDDIELESIETLRASREVVVTEKLDGENTTLLRDHLHARSPDYAPHPSRTWMRRLHAQVRLHIPGDLRICGENLYARHSIRYERLPTYFLVFSIFQDETCLSWDETLHWCGLLGLQAVPELYRGPWNEGAIIGCWTGRSIYGPEQEGYIVRSAGAFPLADHGVHVAKYVRVDHVQGEDHWMSQPVERNGLAGA